MAHIDYQYWARYAHARLQASGMLQQGASQNAPLQEKAKPQTARPPHLLELGCGTGSLALYLQPLGPYRYTATDRAQPMLDVARKKARKADLPIRFRATDFTHLPFDAAYDAALLLYDGVNYLLEEEQVRRLLRQVCDALRPGGLFLFDQSTPFNSAVDPDAFEDEGSFEHEGETIHYHRTSTYDPEQQLHTTCFRIDGPDGRAIERHLQRAYGLDQMRRWLRASPLEELAAYKGFSTAPADERARRIHWLVRRPT